MDNNLAIYAEKKFSEQEIRMACKLLKAIAEDDKDMRNDFVESLRQAKGNFVHNVDAMILGLSS